MLLGSFAIGEWPLGATQSATTDAVSVAESANATDTQSALLILHLSIAESLNATATQSTPSTGGFSIGPLGSFALGELPIGGYRTTAAAPTTTTFNLSVIEAATITTSISFVRGYPHRAIRFMTPLHRGPRSRR